MHGRFFPALAGGIELVADQAAPPGIGDPRRGVDVGQTVSNLIGDGQDPGDMVRGRKAGHRGRLHPVLLCKVWHHGRGCQSGTGTQLLLHCAHHVSMQGRFFFVLAGGLGTERTPAMIQRRVSAGSMTLSISNTEAIETALPLA